MERKATDREEDALTQRTWERPLIGTIALLTVVDHRLSIVCRIGPEVVRLPSFDPAADVGLDEVVRSKADDVVGHGSTYLEQLYTFTASRYGSDSAIVVSYLACAPSIGPLHERYQLVTIDEALGLMSGVDRQIVEYALTRLRAKIGYTTIAFHLMPIEFTLSELQRTYESILGMSLDKRNFRRRILASGLVSPTAGHRAGASHRPAALYQFAAEHDPSAFLTPTAAGDAGS